MRWISTILAAISTLLMLVAIYFWIRSASTYDGIAYFTPSSSTTPFIIKDPDGSWVEARAKGRLYALISQRGVVSFGWIANPLKEPWTWRTWGHPLNEKPESGPMSLSANLADRTFSIGSGKSPVIARNLDKDLTWELPYSRLSLPYWFLVPLLAVYPWFWVSNYMLLLKREREGRCLHCGHELKAQTEGKCPNCGKRIER